MINWLRFITWTGILLWTIAFWVIVINWLIK